MSSRTISIRIYSFGRDEIVESTGIILLLCDKFQLYLYPNFYIKLTLL